MQPAATTLAFAVLLILAGHEIGRRAALTKALGWVAAGMFGVLVLHLWLSLLDILQWRWSVPLILAAPTLLASWRLFSMRRRTLRIPKVGWGDAIASAIVGVFGLLAWTRWIGFADIMFHWGTKAQRYALARHVDYDYLARPESWMVVPHYPNGYTELLAATALLSGGWNEAGVFLWSAVFLGLLVVCVRATLVLGGVEQRRRQLLTGGLAAALGAFGIAMLMGGSPDWAIALAIAAALPGFMVEPTPTSDLYLGICAAFSACMKMEGIFFAVWVLCAQLFRHAIRRRMPDLQSALALLSPATLVIGYWSARLAQYHLSNPGYQGLPTAARVKIAAATLIGPPSNQAWHGFAWLLWLMPLLVFAPRVRAFAVVLLLQTGLYAWSYAAQIGDTRFLVLSSAERLQLHLLPATVTAAAVAWLKGPAPEVGSPPATGQTKHSGICA